MRRPPAGVAVLLGPRYFDTGLLAGCPCKENQGNCTTPDYPSYPAEREGNKLKDFKDFGLKTRSSQGQNPASTVLSLRSDVKSLIKILSSYVSHSRAGCPWKENQGNCTTPDYPSYPAEQEGNNLKGFKDFRLKMAQVKTSTVLRVPLLRRVPVEGESRQLHHP